jgi:hypothetical protein
MFICIFIILNLVMRKLFTIFFCLFSTSIVFAQFGVSAHQSNLSFIGFNYEFKDRFLPELRAGIDTQLDNMSLEAVITYQFLKKEDFEVYAGLGGRVNTCWGGGTPRRSLFPIRFKDLWISY